MVTAPLGSAHARTRCPVVSATYSTLPLASAARPQGPVKAASAPVPSLAPAAPSALPASGATATAAGASAFPPPPPPPLPPLPHVTLTARSALPDHSEV